MNYKQRQKSLLIDPNNILTFNVSHEHIHMKKVRTSSILSSRNPSSDDLQSIPDSSITFNTKIYYSVVEKQSETGISFNDRLFFLRDQDVLGYMSKPDKTFEIKNAKETIPIKCLRRVTPKGKTLMLQFEVKSAKDNTKLVQKKWLLRMRDKKMADAWTDIINYQVGQIPSRKSTMERNDSHMTPLSTQRKQQTQTADKTTNYFSKTQEPIANQRPQQDYILEMKRSEVEAKTPRSAIVTENNQISESPVRDQYTNSSNEKQGLSPELSVQNTYSRESQGQFNSTSEKHSQKKQRYMSSGIKPYQTGEFAPQNTYFQQIQLTFKLKNNEMRQKLILPSFYNYFRPYADQMTNKRLSARMQVDKKYQDFITFCQLTAKQLIDKNQTPLSEFKLSNRYLPLKDSLPKDKLLKEMGKMYEQVFGKPMPQSMELQALFLLFDNILYLSLQDTDLIIPLAELKTLPMASDVQADSNASMNKICENSLITQFQIKEKNLQYIYRQISKSDILKDNFLVPMSCQVQYKGLNMFFRPKINETLFNAMTVYDLSREIAYIGSSNTKNETGQLNLDELYQKLAFVLYINSDVLESQNHFKIKPIRARQNMNDKIGIKNSKDYKYVISFADILPCLQNKQLVEPSIFIKIHQNNQTPDIPLQKSQYNQDSSRKIDPANHEETQMIPSVLKTQSIYKKKQTQKLPLYNQLISAKQNDTQFKLYKQEIKHKVKDVSKNLDRFDVPIIHPYELNQLLKTSSLSHSSLGKIYQEISGKNSFIKSLIKSEIAAECTRLVLSKKCQEILLEPKQGQTLQKEEISMKNVTKLLNLILGKSSTKQTQMIWKVLTLHSQLLYSVSISQQQINKGYFILALSSKMNILINPNSVLIENVFNHDNFIAAIRFQSCKIRPVQVCSQLMGQIQQTQPTSLIQNATFYFKRLQQAFSIASNQIPYFVRRAKHIYNKILLILIQKISPNNLSFDHLNIYQTKLLNFTQTPGSFPLIQQTRSLETATSLIKQKQLSLKRQFWEDNFLLYFRRKLKELQHKAVQKNSFNLEQQVQNIMKEVKVFYEYHPLISELLEFLSDYHFSKGQYQRAIDCLKASLSNIISVCEGNSNHVKLAHCFLKIALVYEKTGRLDEALNQLKRAKHCLEVNKQDTTSLCASLLLRIAQVTLKMDGKIHESLSYVFAAQKILQNQINLYENIETIIDAYQTESKCIYSSQFNIVSLKSQQKIDRGTRSEHYFVTLQKILIKENEISKKKHNHPLQLIDSQKLQKFLKLVLPFYFQTISQKGGQMLMVYMCQLSENIAKRGGVDLTQPQIPSPQQAQTLKLQTNEEPEFFLYPTSTNRIMPQEQQQDTKIIKQTKKQYNYFQAFLYLKRQICNGSFIMEIMQFMQKADEILSIIKQKIKQNNLNKSQSRSSSRVYLMSAKGVEDWDALVNSQNASESNRKSARGNSEPKDGEDIDLEKLLDYSKDVRQSSYVRGYSQRERKFDSVMKALMVLLGDGFMLHIFEE